MLPTMKWYIGSGTLEAKSFVSELYKATCRTYPNATETQKTTVQIDATLIRSAATGPSGLDAACWRRLCIAPV